MKPRTGTQEKTALTKIGRHWYKPLGSTPTTHILKLPLGLVGNRQLDLSHGHAKNFSIYHHRGGSFGLTPLYDVLSTWPVVGKRAGQLDIHELKLAMALRGKSAHYRIVEIQPRHFRALADRYPGAEAWPAMIDLASRVEGAIKALEKRLPKGFAESVWAPISKGVLGQAKSLLSYAKA